MFPSVKCNPYSWQLLSVLRLWPMIKDDSNRITDMCKIFELQLKQWESRWPESQSSRTVKQHFQQWTQADGLMLLHKGFDRLQSIPWRYLWVRHSSAERLTGRQHKSAVVPSNSRLKNLCKGSKLSQAKTFWRVSLEEESNFADQFSFGCIFLFLQ